MVSAAIAEALGLRPSGKDQWSGPCPACGYKSGFGLKEGRQGRLLMSCHAGGCTFRELRAELQRRGLCAEEELRIRSSRQLRPASPGEDPPNREQAVLRMRTRTRPAPGTLAETYLRFRGYRGAIPETIGFARGKHPASDRWHPMMVAAVTIAGASDRIVALHRTFLADDGRGKAELEPAKMSLGPFEGGAVPLFPAGPVLILAEGIENALTVSQALTLPAWSAISASNLPNVVLPAVVRTVILAADRDETGVGERKAREAAKRWSAYGLKAVLMLPPPGRGDWNDLIRSES